MSPESPQQGPNPDRILKPEQEILGKGPDAPGIIYKENPILGETPGARIDLSKKQPEASDEAEQPAETAPLTPTDDEKMAAAPEQEKPKTPEEIKEERLTEIIRELEDEWHKKTGKPRERPLTKAEIDDAKGWAYRTGEAWDGKTTAMTDDFSEFFFKHSGGESVPAKARKLLAERFPEYAEKKEEQEKGPDSTPEANPETKPESKKAEPPENLPIEEVKELSKAEDIPEQKETEAISEAIENAESPEKTWKEAFREKLGVDNILDSAKIAFNDLVAGWYEAEVKIKETAIAAKHQEMQTMTKDAAHIDEQLKAFRADGNISEKSLLKVEKEKQRVESRIEESRKGLAVEQMRLSSLSIGKEGFVKRRDEACRTYIDRTRAELRPYQEQISDLSLTRKQLEGEISKDTSFIEKRREELAKLEAKVEAEKFPSVRKATREIIRRIEAETGAFEKEVRAREKEVHSIDRELVKARGKAQPLSAKCDELERIVKGREEPKIPPIIPLERSGEDALVKRPRVSESYTRTESAPSAPEKPLEVFNEDELIETWNEINGSRMLINPETFKEALYKGGRERKPMSVNEFWAVASMYSARFGDRERLAGMPDMKKEAQKGGGFWKWLFGLTGSKLGMKRLLENLKAKKNPNTGRTQNQNANSKKTS